MNQLSEQQRQELGNRKIKLMVGLVIFLFVPCFAITILTEASEGRSPYWITLVILGVSLPSALLWIYRYLRCPACERYMARMGGRCPHCHVLLGPPIPGVHVSSGAGDSISGWKIEPELKMSAPRPVMEVSPMPGWVWLILLPVFAFALAYLQMGFYVGDHLLRIAILKWGTPATAVVEGQASDPGFRRDAYLVEFSYSTPQGPRRTAALSTRAYSLTPKGTEIAIHYLPGRSNWAVPDHGTDSPIGSFLFAIFMVALVSSSFVESWWTGRRVRRILAWGDPVPAHVIKVSPGGRVSHARLIVRFQYQSQEWITKVKTNSPVSRLMPGDLITVVVDPARPKSAVAYAECGYKVAADA